MAAVAGKDGVVMLESAKIGYVDNWSVAVNQGTAETSQMGVNWKEFIKTAKDWSGSFSGTLDCADAQQKKIIDELVSGTDIVTPTLKLTLGNSFDLEGSVIFSSMSITASHGDKIAVSVNFQGTGAPKLGGVV